MASEQGLYCTSCQRQTLHRQQGPNHILHFLLGFLTCTLWWFVWLILAMRTYPWLCAFCGTPYAPPQSVAPPARVTAARPVAPPPKPLSPRTVRAIAVTATAFGVAVVGFGLFAAWDDARARKRVAAWRAEEQHIRDRNASAPVTAPSIPAFDAVKAMKAGPVELSQHCGKPDRDDSTAYDSPRPPMVTRLVEYRRQGLKIIYVADAQMGEPPPYAGWKHVGAVDIPSDTAITVSEVQGDYSRSGVTDRNRLRGEGRGPRALPQPPPTMRHSFATRLLEAGH